MLPGKMLIKLVASIGLNVYSHRLPHIKQHYAIITNILLSKPKDIAYRVSFYCVRFGILKDSFKWTQCTKYRRFEEIFEKNLYVAGTTK